LFALIRRNIECNDHVKLRFLGIRYTFVREGPIETGDSEQSVLFELKRLLLHNTARVTRNWDFCVAYKSYQTGPMLAECRKVNFVLMYHESNAIQRIYIEFYTPWLY